MVTDTERETPTASQRLQGTRKIAEALERALAFLNEANRFTYLLPDPLQRAETQRCLAEAVRWTEGAWDNSEL